MGPFRSVLMPRAEFRLPRKALQEEGTLEEGSVAAWLFSCSRSSFLLSWPHRATGGSGVTQGLSDPFLPAALGQGSAVLELMDGGGGTRLPPDVQG